MNKCLRNSKKSEQEFEVRYRKRGGLGRCSSLVYDTFAAQVTEDAKVVWIVKENFDLALIPQRLTSVL